MQTHRMIQVMWYILTRVETRPLDKFTSDVLSNLSGSNLTDAATLDLDQARTQSFDDLKKVHYH